MEETTTEEDPLAGMEAMGATEVTTTKEATREMDLVPRHKEEVTAQ